MWGGWLFCWNLILPAGGDFSSVMGVIVFSGWGGRGVDMFMFIFVEFTNFSSFI